MRQKQIIDRKVRDTFLKTGSIPKQGFSAATEKEMYSPQTKPYTPLKKALSDADMHRKTIEGMLGDFKDLQAVVYELNQTIQQLNLASTVEYNRTSARIAAEHRRVRHLAASALTTDVLIDAIPIPYRISNHIRYDGAISLEPLGSVPTIYDIEQVSLFSDGNILDHNPVGKGHLPIHSISKSDGTKTGIDMHVTFEGGKVNYLIVDATPCLLKIFRITNDGKQVEITRKHVDKQTAIQLDEQLTSRLMLRFYQFKKNADIEIRNLSLFHDTYAPSGTYNSMPVKADFSGVLKFAYDVYAPEGTSVEVAVGSDKPVPGCLYYTDANGSPTTIDPDTAQVPGSIMYGNPSGNHTTNLSTIYRHPILNSMPYTLEPDWTMLDEDTMLLHNCVVVDDVTFNTGSSNGKNELLLHTFDTSLISQSVRLSVGRDTWMFIPYSRRTTTQVQDYWTTHLVLPKSGNVYIPNSSGLIRNIQVQPLEITSGSFPNTYGMVDAAAGEFSGELPAGIYAVTLYVDSIPENTSLKDSRATTLTGVVPDIVLPEAAYIQLYPWPAKRHAHTFNSIDPIARYQFMRIDGNTLVVPYMTNNTYFDLYNADYPDERTPSSNSAYLNTFYEVRFLKEVDKEDWRSYLFFKADFSTVNDTLTPLLRDIEILPQDMRFIAF